MKKTFITSKTREYLDKDTGELLIVETEKVQKITTNPESFTMMYVQHLGPMYGLKQANDFKVMYKLCELAQFNTGKVELSAALRDKICEEIGMHTSNLSRHLKKLIDLGLLHGERGSYTIDPKLFWKGDRKVREQLLKEGGFSVTLQFVSE